MVGAAKYTGAVVVTLIGIVFSSISLLPVAVDRLEFNSASLSRELQIWRSQGQYYVHNRSRSVFVPPTGPVANLWANCVQLRMPSRLACLNIKCDCAGKIQAL